ncbi:4-oxalomesaconate tautomerase [Chelativorans sp. M5D2P16]|uniref:4-oxalomesaconate tautomerase n=1 Tax=Chelativorans sp. M5D2P16 TaxID=3095678 RepID=UPI002ACA396F|nr:4-oxalomesaconate tautomerase [Chelativorans sp. M5D2P16]MDZ5696670.1 4-oxalomesaconate tautomerase [Chelativorans sp. M5D2P16]
MSDGVRVMWMRGGTSKGGYFLASELPLDTGERDTFLLRVMGTPDPRQIDGMGGADPLTSKVAVVGPPTRGDADVDYLFLQVFVDQPIVTESQNCGNILAGVGPFALERGLVPVAGQTTDVRIHMVNTGQIAVASVATPDGRVSYEGNARIDGVPGTAAPVPIVFRNTSGSTCGALLPTGNAVDEIEGVPCTLIDDGMPCVIMAASAFGLAGAETPEALEENEPLKVRLEVIRRAAGPLMNLGDVAEQSVPKMTLVSTPRRGGTISTRSFIPHRVHKAVGVLAAVSVGTACLLPHGPAREVASVPDGQSVTLDIEHPTGAFGVVVNRDAQGNVESSGVLRTARKLMEGRIFS